MKDSEYTSQNIAKTKDNKEEEEEINKKISTQKESKKGNFMLTPLESLLLNKLMPHGFKFETEENLLKVIEASKSQVKRHKHLVKHSDIINNRNYDKINSISQMKRRTQQRTYNIENLPNNVSPEIYKETQKCWLGLNRIKDIQWSNNFYQSNSPDIPCLSKIEQKLNNYEYTSFYYFSMDIRNIWNYYFSLGDQDNSDIYDITSKMSGEWEKICSEIENINDDNYSIANNIKKRSEKIQKDYNENRQQLKNNENISPPSKKIIEQNNENKPMTLEEKTNLGNSIRSLNKEQLKGIIKILANNNIKNNKYFEFDIDTLSTKKLRELEKYVKSCLSSNNNIKQTITVINNNINQRDNQNNMNINKDMNNIPNNPQNSENKTKEQNNNNKEINETLEKKEDLPTENKFQNNNENNEDKAESFSESDSLSSGSSLSN